MCLEIEFLCELGCLLNIVCMGVSKNDAQILQQETVKEDTTNVITVVSPESGSSVVSVSSHVSQNYGEAVRGEKST